MLKNRESNWQQNSKSNCRWIYQNNSIHLIFQNSPLLVRYLQFLCHLDQSPQAAIKPTKPTIDSGNPAKNVSLRDWTPLLNISNNCILEYIFERTPKSNNLDWTYSEWKINKGRRHAQIPQISWTCWLIYW